MKYLKYSSFIKLPNITSSNVIPENMFFAQQNAFGKLQDYILKDLKGKKFQSKDEMNLYWLMSKLNIQSQEELVAILSPEQMDSVCLAIYNIENGSEFIIGDDTGIGKGRIIAAIGRYILNRQKKSHILFFTEGTHLFNDFWRDVKNTGTESFLSGESPFFLHTKGNIYNRQNEKIYSALSKKNLDYIISSKQFVYTKNKKEIDAYSNIMLTTYSQFNSENSASSKLEFLKDYLKHDNLIVFDEFHNSIGDSTTKEMKDKLLSLSDNINAVFSSATFLDNFDQILSFKKLLKLDEKRDKKIIQVLQHHTDGNFNELKNQIAFYLTEQGNLLRREHEPVEKINYREIDSISKDKLNFLVRQYNDIIFQFFKCYYEIEKINAKSTAISDKVRKIFKNKWLMFGAKINRLNKLLILLSKKDYLIQQIEESLNQNQKAIIIMESTFESVIQTCIEYVSKYHDCKDGYPDIHFRTLLLEMVDNVVNHAKAGIDYRTLNNDSFNKEYGKLQELIDRFPIIEISFIDELSEYFSRHNKKFLEISGRTKKLVKKDSNRYVVESLNNEDKSIVASEFNNNQDCNIILITRSGSTGISLHSSSEFKDQKQRKMFEPEISSRVKIRKQFFGRHNRRGQVNKPEFESIVSGLPFEKRIVALEEEKNRSMKAFTGSDYQISSIDYDYYNQDINDLVQLYLINNPHIAKKLGISSSHNEEPFYFIDMLLKRSILLSPEEQEKFYDYLDLGHYYFSMSAECYDQNILNKNTDKIMVSEVKTFTHNFSQKDLESFEKLHKKERFNPDLSYSVASVCKGYTQHSLNKITEKELKKYIPKNFDDKQYISSVDKSRKLIYQIYGNNKLVIENLNKLKKLKPLLQISFKINGNKFFGYVENLKYHEEYSCYLSHYLYKIRLINPIHHKHNYLKYGADFLYITANVLLENEGFTVYSQLHDFQKYIRNSETVTQDISFLSGNMFYLHYLKQIHKTGEYFNLIKEIDGKQKQLLLLKIPFDEKKSYLPIFNYYSGLEYLNKGKLIKDCKKDIMIKKEGYRYFVYLSDYILADDTVISYPVKKNLTNIQERKNGYTKYELNDNFFKKLFFILFNNKNIFFHA